MKRRTFIRNSAVTGLGVTAFGLLDSNGKAFPANSLRVSGQRIESRIAELATFGRNENGH